MPHPVFFVFFAAGLVLAGAAFASDTPASGPITPAARVKAIEADVADALAVYQQAWGKQTDRWPLNPDVQKLGDEYGRKWKAGRDQAMEIAKADPASPGGFAALEWLLSEPAYASPYTQLAMELMARHHATNPAVGKTVALLGHLPPIKRFPIYPAFFDFLTAVAAKNPDRTARGQAALGLAFQTKVNVSST